MTFSQLQCFVEVAKHLNFARAGEALYISQPAVSNQIRSLESELGIKLFERSRHTVELTAAGASLYADTAQLLDHFSLSVQRAKNIQAHYSEELRIGYLGSLHISALPEIYRNYQKQRPQTHILNIALQTPIWNPCSDRDSLDIVFGSQQDFPLTGSVRYKRLYLGRIVCVLPQSHPLVQKKMISFSDLSHEVLILLDTVHCPPRMESIQKQLQRACPDATYYFSSSAEHTLPMIQGRIGIAVMPDYVFQPLPGLLALPIEPTLPTDYGIAWRTDHQNEQKIREFVQITCRSYGIDPPQLS